MVSDKNKLNARISAKKIVLLAGGPSKEAEVSLMSAKHVADSLARLGYNFEVIDPDENFVEELKAIKPDIVFNCLHGRYGEDGAIQGILEYLKIPYTHSGILGSSICFDKKQTYNLLQGSGIQMIDSKIISIKELRELLSSNSHPYTIPYVIKPVTEGSAIGVYIVKTAGDIPSLKDWSYGNYAVIQEYIPGKELTCTVFDGNATAVTELRPSKDKDFYDYEAKYSDGITQHILPAEIPDDITNLCKEYSKKAHEMMGLRTVSRSDFRYDPNRENGLYYLETNSHPGLTSLSNTPEALKYDGISFDDMIEKLLQDAKLELTS